MKMKCSSNTFIAYDHDINDVDDMNLHFFDEVCKLHKSDVDVQLKAMNMLLRHVCDNVMPGATGLSYARFEYACSKRPYSSGYFVNSNIKPCKPCMSAYDIVFCSSYVSRRYAELHHMQVELMSRYAKLANAYTLFYQLFNGKQKNFAIDIRVPDAVFKSYVTNTNVEFPKYTSVEEAIIQLGLLGYDLSDVLKISK